MQLGQGQPHVECNPKTPQYDWESLNYYELLGLAWQDELDLEAKDIRKAYRKQAQIWHPDKSTNQKNNNSTIEECTARFARISEAYEILSDPPKRKEYDRFLQYCDEIRQQDRSSDSKSFRWSNLFQNFGDPLRVFEEFFFGGYEDEVEDDFWNADLFREASSAYSRHQQHKHQRPERVSKQQQILQDPFSGEEIIRISQTEEYPVDHQSGKFYYRIISQEFVKRFDPYTGINLQPITQPYLSDEGYRRPSDRKTQQQRSPFGAQPQLPPSLLFPGDVLTSTSSKLLVSPNQRYYAGLSPECELLIMAENRFGEDDLIWSSETFGKNCFATLRGPHLVIAMGHPEQHHQILWYSEAFDYGGGDNYGFFQQRRSTYMAQLDNDGSLAVYKVWNQPLESQTMAGRAWLATRNFLLGTSRADYDDQFVSNTYNNNSIIFKRCIYATGPLGCFRLARRFYQLSFSIYYSIKHILARIDNAFDDWMDLIMEEDDFARAFKEYGSAFGSGLANKSARLVRRVLEFMMSRQK